MVPSRFLGARRPTGAGGCAGSLRASSGVLNLPHAAVAAAARLWKDRATEDRA